MEPPPQTLSPPPLQRTSSIPTTLLNKYEVGRLLGRGSFAKVYAASSLSDKTQLVAIKIIDKTKTDAAMEPRIISEISAMHRLQHHPNVLKIHEVMATKTKIYLVMELASGGDLFSKIRKMGKLKETAARRYFQQLVSAIHFCHQNGVSHRDIKPHNLLLTACGTPAFTAPEVLARRGYDGSKADAWSCGVILFFLLSASLPFNDSNLAVMYRKIHKGEYQSPSCLPKPVKSIINQLLDPNPNKRMSIEALMKHPWFLKKFELPTKSSVFESDYKEYCKFDKSAAGGINAFDLISLSSGLDLSGLFEVKLARDRRFTSSETVERVTERVREVGGRLGYRVEEGKGGGAIGLGKGKGGLVFEVWEIVEKLLVVEVKVVGGGGVEFEDLHWGELKEALGDVVLQWNDDAM
ncbi:CBL-interacting serine/threonine-protein kinase 4-like [Populus alba x Populus x berolinensis]|nr:CBL-interacting serine/threonine-protein kinase 4-like [Populus alba x Populus x berolinensis]